MSAKSKFKHEATGVIVELSEAVAKLFPAFRPLSHEATDQSQPVQVVTEVAPAIVQAPTVVIEPAPTDAPVSDPNREVAV